MGFAIVPCAKYCGVMDAVAVDALLKRAFTGDVLIAKNETVMMQMRRRDAPNKMGKRFFFLVGGGDGFARFARGIWACTRCGELFFGGEILRFAQISPFFASLLFGLIFNARSKNLMLVSGFETAANTNHAPSKVGSSSAARLAQV